MRKATNIYHTAGWKRFELNRRRMLANYDLAKFENEDRPLETEHGVIAEASLRKWLAEFLPDRYGVTSGYIIPPVLESEDYTRYHYDVIIYDKLDSPVVWEGCNDDASSQGQRRAIPAGRVRAVLEVKANLTYSTATEVKDKLNEINLLRKYFPRGFFVGAVFFELKTGNAGKTGILKNIIPDGSGSIIDLGCILRCNVNADMSGVIQKFTGRMQGVEDSTKLYRDIDQSTLRRDSSHTFIQDANFPSSPGIFDLESADKFTPTTQHFYKRFICSVGKKFGDDTHGVSIEWSRNGFTIFILSILSRFSTGSDFRNQSTGGSPFGLTFDNIEKCATSI